MALRDETDDIAVIGMACRVAGANSPSELWDILASSKDVQSVITRFNTEGYYHPQGGPRKGSTNVRHAYMMNDEAIDKFDHAFFHITPVEALAIDPQQRMLLEVAYESIENAGMPLEDFTGTDTAVMAGVEGCDYHDVIARDIDATPRYLATGTPMCMAANRLSYFFNLSGPSVAMDTACSSTMAALHHAVRALQHGDSSMALVCGAKLIITPNMFVPSTELGFLSPSGRSRSFDAAADGYGRGEGIISLLLKPLRAAIADGDPVRAVIKGTRLNQDGRTQGITLPSANAQKDNMEKLYSKLGISPMDIQYLEAHGTGTAGGDKLEFSAINAVFGEAHRDRPLIVGALKSCIGHLEACAGLASVVKTIECLERGQIPPQMHFQTPNPKIDFRHVEIPLTMLKWPTTADQIRRAGINTFGAGGTNAHAVVESYRNHHTIKTPCARTTYLFMVSAVDENSLRRSSLKYADYIEQFRPKLCDLAHTLLARRSKLSKSILFAASTDEDAICKLRSETPRIHSTHSVSTNTVVFLFTGQGAQWPEMGKVLIEQSQLFESVLRRCDEVLARLPDGPSWSIVDEIRKCPPQSNVYDTLYSQSLCTALQLGVVVLLRSWGISPVAVVGHSSGEIAAAYTAGILSFENAIIVAYYRGVLLRRTKRKYKGGMCAVGMGRSDAERLLEPYKDRVQLAAVNSPDSCTLSGNIDVIMEIQRQCEQNAIFCRKLPVDTAYHSHHVMPEARFYERALKAAGISHKARDRSCKMFSSVTGKELEYIENSPRYWKDNMISTVQFDSALTECLRHQSDDFVIFEAGPHPALRAPAETIMRAQGRKSLRYLYSLSRQKNDMEVLLENVGEMIACGISLERRNINGIEIVNGLQRTYEFAAVLKDLPSYQWNHSAIWYEARSSRKQRFRQFPRHEILGSRYLEDTALNPSWRSLLVLDDVPWLAALKSKGGTYLPTATFILMAAEAARQIFVAAHLSLGFVEIFDIFFCDNLPLSLFETTSGIELHCIVQLTEQANQCTFEISYLLPGLADDSKRLCSGSFRWIETLPQQDDKISPKLIPCYDDSWLLEQSEALNHGISARLINAKVHSKGSSGLFENIPDPFDHYCIDPEILHSIFQVASISSFQWAPPSVQKITSIRSFTFPLTRLRGLKDGYFITNVQPAYGHLIRADVNVNFGERYGLSIENIQLANEDCIRQKPTKRSLFFKPVVLPDITKMQSTTKSIGLCECLTLVTHKWPMSDIAMIETNDEDARTILDALQSAECGGRQRFRSVSIMGDARAKQTSSKIRFLDRLTDDCRYHLTFLGNDSVRATEACKTVLPKGLLCLLTVDEDIRHSLPQTFTKLCDISRPDEWHSWSLWRRDEHDLAEQQPCSHPSLTIFSSNDHLASLGEAYPGAECILLEPAAINMLLERGKLSDGNRDAIIIDEVEKSIITTWSGEDLVPWFQLLLSAYKNILWVTSESWACNPHHGVAGNLLRSFQAEKPSLKIGWLKFQNIPIAKMPENVSHVYRSLKSGRGDNEVLLEVTDSDVKILRYLPNDELSVLTGVRLPWNAITSDLRERNYEVALGTSTPKISTWNERGRHGPERGDVGVKIEASTVDISDVWAFKPTSKRWNHPLPCRFFAGRVDDPGQVDFAQGSPVVGWYQGPHCGQVSIVPAHLYLRKDTILPATSAVRFASLCIGLCIVDGCARARKGDLFKIRVEGPIREIVAKLCKKSGAEVLEENSRRSATFTIDLTTDRGFLVNDAPLDVEDYLTSRRGRDLLRQHWSDCVPDCLPSKTLNLTELPKSFTKLGQRDIYSTVLDHTDRDDACGVTVKSRSGPLLTSDGTYILIGGLGGLGRFVCSWMVENGARNLVVISRSGLQSQAARDTHSAINASDASLKVIEADASDRIAIHDALVQIRGAAKIRGVLNLAMVLEDSDFASMTGEQWDRAVGLKRDSSWILHEETLNDPLDFFILFSSVASVLGNRGQGNYNIGNTFLNALAKYRRSLGMTGVSIALGAMTEIGVLHDLGKEGLVDTLHRSGLSALGKRELAKIIEAAVLESRCLDRSLVLTGLEMFDRIDGNLVGSRDQTQLFWTELPEFGFLQDHRLIGTEDKPVDTKHNLHDRALMLSDTEAHILLQEAFIEFLSQLLGYDVGNIQAGSSLLAYGLDSLNALSCQFWVQRNLSVDIPVAKIFDAPSIADLARQVWIEISGHSSNRNST